MIFMAFQSAWRRPPNDACMVADLLRGLRIRLSGNESKVDHGRNTRGPMADASEVAAFFSVSVQTIANWADAGKPIRTPSGHIALGAQFTLVGRVYLVRVNGWRPRQRRPHHPNALRAGRPHDATARRGHRGRAHPHARHPARPTGSPSARGISSNPWRRPVVALTSRTAAYQILDKIPPKIAIVDSHLSAPTPATRCESPGTQYRARVVNASGRGLS